MKQQFYDLYGRITPKSNSFVLRSIYHSLTGDCSGARSTSEEEIDNRVTEALAMQDPDVIVDLRHLNSNESDCFTVCGRNAPSIFLLAQLFMREDMTLLLLWQRLYLFVTLFKKLQNYGPKALLFPHKHGFI